MSRSERWLAARLLAAPCAAGNYQAINPRKEMVTMMPMGPQVAGLLADYHRAEVLQAQLRASQQRALKDADTRHPAAGGISPARAWLRLPGRMAVAWRR